MLRTLSLLFFLSLSLLAGAQSAEEKAVDLIRQAIALMDNGQIDESLLVLEKAWKLDPKNSVVPYEMGYAHYLKEDYVSAVKAFETALKFKDANAQYYQMLGNAYDNAGRPKEALATYKKGIKKFPTAGRLYLEMGIMSINAGQYDEGVSWFEQGVTAEPAFSSNYYHLSKLFLNSGNKVWGMVYGELFLNLERNSRRTTAISELLYISYRDNIEYKTDTSVSANFNKNPLVITSSKDLKNLQAQLQAMITSFDKFAYGTTMCLAAPLLNEQGQPLGAGHQLTLPQMHTLRSHFLDLYYQKGYDKQYANPLFPYQRQVQKAGHLEAYNYWILSSGDPEGFDAWQAQNKATWTAFVDWFMENPLKLNPKNHFARNY
jgi:tetratricopeptide (TPR) repeat protein